MVYAKKKFGQNFLVDEAIKSKIIEAMPRNDNIVVEVGPGLGDLTKKLLEKKQVVAVEIDKELGCVLQTKFESEIKKNRLKIVLGDVLEIFEKNKTLQKDSYDLIANLPYYVATNIILSALKDKNCKNILVMVQKEVAKRFAAKAGDKEFSSLSVLANNVSRVTYLFDVDKTSFKPQPKIISAVVLFEKFQDSFDEDFAQFLKIIFKQPRKTAVKNLSFKYEKQKVSTTFDKLNLSLSLRAHQLGSSILLRLFTILHKKGSIDGTGNI